MTPQQECSLVYGGTEVDVSLHSGERTLALKGNTSNSEPFDCALKSVTSLPV